MNIMKKNSFKWDGPPIADACVISHPNANLLVLDHGGGLHFVDSRNGAQKHACTVELPDAISEEERPYFGAPRHRLHVSIDGSHAAIVVDRGSKGILVDVPNGRIVKHLADDNYHSYTVPFSACFVERAGHSVFIHRTNWNRLDACDARTGELLTPRGPTSYKTAEERPEHYLDYFHGGLLPSPDGKLLFDDGWVWHPVAVPRLFSIERWLNENAWECEDGSTAKQLIYRDDWNFAACWIDNDHIAWSGLAAWDYDEFQESGAGNGVRIMNVHGEFGEAPRATDRVIPMPEPVIRLFADSPHLHAVSAETTTTWNIASGACVAEIEHFAADLFDPALRLFTRILPDEIQTCPAP